MLSCPHYSTPSPHLHVQQYNNHSLTCTHTCTHQQRSISVSSQRDVQFYERSADCLADVSDGSKLLVGGFGLCGIPENLINAVKEKGLKELTCVSNNAG